MNLTNRHGLPAPLVSAVTWKWYQKEGHISATSLLKSPRQRWLQERHHADITEDASDRIWSLFGSAVHAILERQNVDNHLIEERLWGVVHGWTVTGRADVLSDRMVLSDYKVTSVYSFAMDDKREWEEQLNIYAWLYRHSGFTVEHAQIVAILRDWRRSELLRDSAYPPCPVVVKPIQLWTLDEQREFVERRVALHKDSASLTDDALPPCSDEDRWASPTQYALMRHGQRRAVRLFRSRHDAEKALSLCDAERYRIDVRPGMSRRCEQYCTAAPWCNQWAEEKTERAA